MQLALHRIEKLEARLELLSGLRIGASEGEIRIGGVDNQVIRNPHTGHPYVPGSSLKGKVRSLLEWLSGAVKERPLSYQDLHDRTPLVKPILQLFGVGGGDRLTDDVVKRLGIEPRDITDDRGLVDAVAARLGPTRLAFWDAPLNEGWREKVEADNNLLVEVKTENRIDRIRGVAEGGLRQTERVPAGAVFDFTVSIKVLSIDADDGGELRRVLYRGLRLLELDSLGGSGSRGYGKVKFRDLKLDGVPVQAEFESLDPFSA